MLISTYETSNMACHTHCSVGFLVPGNTQKNLTEIWHQFWHKSNDENICYWNYFHIQRTLLELPDKILGRCGKVWIHFCSYQLSTDTYPGARVHDISVEIRSLWPYLLTVTVAKCCNQNLLFKIGSLWPYSLTAAKCCDVSVWRDLWMRSYTMNFYNIWWGKWIDELADFKVVIDLNSFLWLFSYSCVMKKQNDNTPLDFNSLWNGTSNTFE